MPALPGTAITSIEFSVEFDWNNDANYEDVVQRHRLKTIEIEYGRSVATALFGVANVPRARVVIESEDNRYVPWNSSSPLYPNVSTGAPARVRVRINGVYYTLFTGYVARVEPNLRRPTEVEVECEGRMSRLARAYPVFSPYVREKVPTVISYILSSTLGSGFAVEYGYSNAEVVGYAADGSRSALELIRELERIDDGFFTEWLDGTLYYYRKRMPTVSGTFPLFDDRNTGASTYIFREMLFVDETLVTRAPYGGLYEVVQRVEPVFEHNKPFALAPQETRDFEFEVSGGRRLMWLSRVDVVGSSPTQHTYTVLYNDGMRAVVQLKNNSASSTLIVDKLTIFYNVMTFTTKRGVSENTTAKNRIGARETSFDSEVVPYYIARNRAEFVTSKYASPYTIIEVTFDGLLNVEHARLPVDVKQNDIVYFGSKLLDSRVLLCVVEGVRIAVGNNADYRITYTLTNYVNETPNRWVLNSSALNSSTRLWYQ